jgi:hypothetical protein
MLILFAALMTIAALAAIAYPLFRRPEVAATEEGARAMTAIGAQPNQEQLEELVAQRDAAVQALRELSFDRQVGKITDADFGVFETNLKLAAAGAFRALDQWEADADRRLGPGFSQELAVRTRGIQGVAAGPQCGHAATPGDRFCAACGATLVLPVAPAPVSAPTRCPSCGQAAAPGDRFCAGCGKPLPEPAHASVN